LPKKSKQVFAESGGIGDIDQLEPGTLSRWRVRAFELERQNRCRFFDILPAQEKGEDCKLGLSE
jgi:hypothetical protein